MYLRASLFILPAVAAIALAGSAFGGGGGTAMDRAAAAGWTCHPAPIIGYEHCAPPGKASIMDIATGAATPPSVELRVFNLNGSFAGTESLLHEDLYRGQPCRQDGLASWGDTGIGYFACHHFETGV